jgi:hypothetical protein
MGENIPTNQYINYQLAHKIYQMDVKYSKRS